jgi:hypothetical protein
MSYDEVRKFNLDAKKLKNAGSVVNFFTNLASSTTPKWIKARQDIKKTSTIPPGGKRSLH